MRAYAGLDSHLLAELRLGMPVTTELSVPASEEEDAEFDALEAAAGTAQVVAAVDVDSAATSFTLDEVAAFHVDADGSGHLQWFAPQEVDQVVDLLD